MMSSEKTISIFLPTYNRYKDGHLKDSIESIINQSYKNFELFIVDDGSIDGSENLIKEYSYSDSRIKHMRFEKNTGLPAYTTSVAFQRSKGEYLAFVFDDCIIYDNHLEILSDALENSNHGMVYGKAIALINDLEKKEFGMPYDKSIIDRGDNYIPNVAVMIRRSVIEDIGWYDPHIIIKRLCDWDLWRRIGNKYSIGFVDKILAIEKGIKLNDSLGNNYTVKPDLVLKYASLKRNERLNPGRLTKESAFDLEILNLLNYEETKDFWFLVLEHYINIGQVDEIFNNEKLTNGILSLINKNSEDYYKNKNDVLFNLISFYFRSRISDIQLQNRLLEIQKEQEIKLKEQEIKLKEQEIKLIHKHYLDSKEYKLGKYINKVFSIFFPLDTVHRKIVIFVIKKIIFMLKDIHKMYHKKKIPISYNKIISSNKKIYILAVPDGYIPSSELAITIPFNYLKKEKIINYHIKLVDDVKKKDIEKADIVFLFRLADQISLKLFNKVFDLDKKIIYAIDDDFEHLEDDSILKQHLIAQNAFHNIRHFCSNANAVIVYSDYMKQKYLKINSNTIFVSNFANFEFIEKIKKRKIISNKTKIKIGYLGSSASKHTKYFSIIKPVIETILNEYGSNIQFELMGIDDDITKKYENAKYIPFVKPLKNFYQTMVNRNWDIGLAPIIDNEFERSKTDNKYREYASLGIAGIYSNLLPYKNSVIHNETGLLVNNTFEDWYCAIKRCIEENDLRKKLKNNAYRDIRERYSLDKFATRYKNIFLSTLNKYNILVVTPGDIASVHIDILNPFRELKKSNIINYSVISVSDIKMIKLDYYDFVVIHREIDKRIVELIKKARKKRIKTIYSWDDNFFKFPAGFGNLSKYYNNYKRLNLLKIILKEVDLVKVTNKYLEAESKKYNHNTVIQKYTFDFSLLNGVNYCDEKMKSKEIHIGYFGNPGIDFEFVINAIIDISNEFPDVIFEFIGHIPNKIEKIKNYKIHEPIYDYPRAIKFFASLKWDIGLAPLTSNEFNLSKGPTKYRDYGACRVAGIYSDIIVYNEYVENEKTGLLVENNERSWYMAIKRLIIDVNLRNSIINNAYNDVYKNHNLSSAVEGWRQIFSNIFNKE